MSPLFFHPVPPRQPHWRKLFVALLVLAALMAPGCSRRHYREAADRQAYRIIQQAEQRVFGHTNVSPFTIDTRFSTRRPEEIHPDEILADRSTTNRILLDLEQALGLAVRNSREYQAQKEQLYLAALSLTGARQEFSPTFFSDPTATFGGSPAGADTGRFRTRVGVEQLLRTGGDLSVSLANDIFRYFTGYSSSPGNSAINTLSVSLTQPILRGFGRNSPKVEALTQTHRNVIYAVRTFSQYQRQFAVDVVNAHFGLLSQKDQVRNNYTNFLRRADTTRYIEARSIDRASRLQVDEARSQELAARIGYVSSVANYLNSVANFKIRLGIPQSDEIYVDDRDLRELASTGLIPIEIGRRAAFRLAVERHLDIITAIDRFEDTQRKLRVAADQLKPGIVVSSSVTLESQAPYDYANFDLDNLRYNTTVGLDLPLNRVPQRNSFRGALISFESQIRSLSQTLDTFRRDIENGLRVLEQQRLNYLSRREALTLATSREENSRLSFAAGRATIRDVRDAQDALVNAQNDVTFTQVSYLQSRLDLLLDVGVLETDLPRFWLADPLASLLSPEMREIPTLRMPGNEPTPPNQFLEPTR